MESIEYFLQKHQKELELEQARLGIRKNDEHNKTYNGEDSSDAITKQDEANPFKIFDELQVKENASINLEPQPITNEQSRQNNSNDMDQCVTDAFYSYFPSFNKIEVEKRSKSRAQQRQEYNEFLNRNSYINHPKHAAEKQPSRRNIPANEIKTSLSPPVDHTFGEKLESESSRIARESSPRYKHLKDLQHTDLTNLLNSDTVETRNKLIIEEDNRKKMEYQRDLVKQIEDKRLEIERLKQKEKFDDELLTKRLEDQLRTLELEEELKKQKVYSEKTRLTNEQNHILRMHILSKLDNDHKIYNPYDVRKTQSENGKEKFSERDENLGNVSRSSEDNKIYKYFTNSAHNENIVLPEINNNNKNRVQYCKSCLGLMPVDWVTFYGDKLNVCPKCVKICPFCNHHRDEKPAKINPNDIGNYDDHINRRPHKEIEEVRVHDNSYHEKDVYKEEDDDDDYTIDLNPIYVKSRNKKPFSMNLEKDSIFNPSHRVPESKVAVNIKNGEIYVDKIIEKPLKSSYNIEKLKERTDEKISKYYKNYDDIRKRRSSIGNNSKMPKNTNAFQVLEDTPIRNNKRSNNTHNDGIRVLTKLGAIRKQLQLEQLEMDNPNK